MPRFANWQHLAPGGSYVTGLGPYTSTAMDPSKAPHPQALQWLEPGESRTYDLAFAVHTGDAGINKFARYDGKIVAGDRELTPDGWQKPDG